MAELVLKSEPEGEVTKHVIFIHGLGGDPDRTWMSASTSKEFWPHWLAKDIEQTAIWTVGYDAAISRWRGAAMHLPDRAKNVLARILCEPKLRSGEIILIGHSLGGLVIKEILRKSDVDVCHDPDAAHFVSQVRRVAFLATPHSGSGFATLADRFRIFFRPSAATSCLVRNDPHLRDLNQWYRRWSEHKIAHLILVETQPIGLFCLVVKPDSSDPGLSADPIPIDANHITISKPKDRASEIYVHIRDLITRQPGAISSRISFGGLSVSEQAIKLAKEIRNVDDNIQKYLSVIQRARFFGGFSVSEQAIKLGEKIRNGEFESGSYTVKSHALAWCARFLATEDSAKADELLDLAERFGSGPEITIAKAFRLSADGDLEGALYKLADFSTLTARSAAFMIVTNHKDAASAIEWLSQSGITHANLDPDGKFTLIAKLFELDRWNKGLECVVALQEEDYQHTPSLYSVSAMAHLVQVVPDEWKSLIHQVLFMVSSFPLASTADALETRRKAQKLFSKAAYHATELGCVEPAKTADDYALWLELCDPKGHNSGIEKLKASMRNPEHSLRRLHFALQFNLQIDIEAVEREIEQKTALSGGNSPDAARARFSLALIQRNPKEQAAYIDLHRPQLHKHFGKKPINITEIKLLAQAGLPEQAEERLKEFAADELSEAEYGYIRRIISESTEADPVEARRIQFESSRDLEDLVNLVLILEKQKDWPLVCHYGALLFEQTHYLPDAERFAQALASTGRHNEIIALLERYPEFTDQSDNLLTLLSWSFYYEGLFSKSYSALEKLRKRRNHANDRGLAANLAIASGAWDTLVRYVEEEWDNREQRNAEDLIRTAHIAQHAGLSRAKDLTREAALKGNNDAGILASAYMLATSAGWENEEPVAEWLTKANELSGENGPLKKMSIRELVDKKPEWDRIGNEIWQKLTAGDIPIFVAATFLNRSLVDMILLPALANPSEIDPRKRILIPAYSGVRHPVQCSYRVVAMEATTLLTLGLLELLETACDAFEQIVIPHSTLEWLFEERQKVTFHQPSRIEIAHKLSNLLMSGALKAFSASATVDADLVGEVGETLASFIAEAQAVDSADTRQRFVIRSAPVYRVNSLMEEEADLALHYPHLCSCMAVVDKLKQKGQLTLPEERFARSYLSLCERRWPNEPELSDNAVIYLDDLSVSFLRHTKLLEKLRPAGLEVYISKRQIEEVHTLLRYEGLASEVVPVIESIRSFLATGIETGKVKVGRMTNVDKTDHSALENHPSFAILKLANETEAIFTDDRFFNQYRNAENSSPTLTTLDFIDALHSGGKITFEEMLDYRTKLRRANYIFVPVTTDELQHCLSVAEIVDGHLIETAELKAIRHNFLQIRASNFLQLPKEVTWLESLMGTVIHTMKAQWQPKINIQAAIVRSEWLLKFLDVRDWTHCYSDDDNHSKVEQRHYEQIVTLLLAPSSIPPETKQQYWEWIEKRVWIKIQTEDPGLYSSLVRRIRESISQNPQAAPSVLTLFPPAVRESLISDFTFQTEYKIPIDATISIGDTDVSFQRSTLHNGIREILANSDATPVVKDTAGEDWHIELYKENVKPRIVICHEECRFPLPDFSALSPNPIERLYGFEQEANAINLPEKDATKWRNILRVGALSDDELEELTTDINETPVRIADTIISELGEGRGNVSSLVPRSKQYFDRLVGDCQQSLTILEYANGGAKKHIDQLLSWRPYDGFLFALLMSSHSSISSAINVDRLNEEEIVKAYAWLQENGDRISQVGAIEIGLSVLDKYPGIERHIQGIVQQIRDDNPEDDQSRFKLLSSLIVLVDGELSQTKTWGDKSPFQRRLASIAQAALIERSIEHITGFSTWAMQAGVGSFYFQSMSDLRREPRWRPDFLFPNQLKTELISRILNAAQQNVSKIESSVLKETLLGNGPESLKSCIEFPLAFLPGPLEGGLMPQSEPPADLVKKIEEQMNADVLQLSSFIELVTSALFFRLDSHLSQLAAKALRTVKYQLKQTSNKDLLLSVLNGLSTVAAVTRSSELAVELRNLTRRCMYESGHSLSIGYVMEIGLIAAASHAELTHWCEFVGEWITYLAFQPLQKDEMEKLLSYIEQLCRIEPELWCTCARAKAALIACLDTF